MDELHRYQQARLTVVVGAIANVVQAFLKILFGIVGHSHAMVADGIHSLSDLLVDGLVLFASKIGSRSADLDHPYGHRRIETAATVAIALLLIMAGSVIMYDAGEHLWSGEFVQPHPYVIWIALISVIVNELLFHYTLHVGQRVNSSLITANAWHHRSDALASLAVLIGVVGATIGWVYLDAVAAIVVGIMVIKMGWDLGWSNICELVDTGVDDDTLAQINKVITAVPGVTAIHQLRTRSMGGNILVDVHVLVTANLSVSEGHYISTQVHKALDENFAKIVDVTVHIDPELDEVASLCEKLPSRQQLVPELLQAWQGLAGCEQIDSIMLHYLTGKIQIELILRLVGELQSADQRLIAQSYANAVTQMSMIQSVKVFFTS
ncbi:cation diffusion facilitator family transporter [soil metagenome]